MVVFNCTITPNYICSVSDALIDEQSLVIMTGRLALGSVQSCLQWPLLFLLLIKPSMTARPLGLCQVIGMSGQGRGLCNIKLALDNTEVINYRLFDASLPPSSKATDGRKTNQAPAMS